MEKSKPGEPNEAPDRLAAGRKLLSMPLPVGPEPDWKQQKREMLDERMRKIEGAEGQANDFASLKGAWRGRAAIGEDFDELPDDLAEALDSHD
jgi:hypothetical protein